MSLSKKHRRPNLFLPSLLNLTTRFTGEVGLLQKQEGVALLLT